jgi:hypothetical protein
MGVVSGVNTVTDGLIFYVDPTNTNTYSGVGTTAYNLIPGGINNFSLNNGVAFDLSKKAYLSFDGTNDYVGLGSTTIFNSTAFTVSFWIKPTAYSGTVCSGAVSNGQYTIFGTTSTYQGYSSTFSGAIQTGGSSNSVATVNQSNFSTNKWYHYVAVYDSAGTGNSTKFKIYIDGAIKSLTFDAAMPSTPYAAGQEARIGWGPGGGAYPYYNGNIGLVQIHRRALSSTEILQSYNSSKSRYNNVENIVTDSLVYNLDSSNPNSYTGTGTTWYDISGNNKNFTLVSSPTFSKNNSGSLTFSSQYAYSSSPTAFTRFTIDCWIKFNAIPVSIYPCVLTQTYPNTTSQLNYSLGFCGFTGKFNGGFYDGGWRCPTGITPVTGVWYYAAVTYDGSTVKFYINGALDSSLSYSGTPYSSGATDYIGRRWDGSEFLNAEIPNVKLYNKALSADEILQNYNAAKDKYINVLPPVSDSLVLNLDAGNRASYAGTGTTWNDLSGRGNNFSLLNGVVFAGSGTTTYMSFDGTNDRATFTGGVNLGTSHTVSVMFKPNDAGMNAVIFGDIGFNNTGYAFYVNSNTAYYAAGETYQSISFTNSTNWMYLTVVRNGTSLTFYKNETSLGSTTLSLDSILKVSSLGGYAAGDYPYTGSIAIATCYTRALSASEVLQNFNSVRSRYNI